MELEGKVVVVTGAASGIGRALALAAADAGARGVAVADLDRAGAERVADEVRGAGARALAVRVDVSRESEVRALVARTEAELGPVDVFCANAGVLTVGGIEAPDAVWDKAFDVNVKSHLYAARAVIPGMVERGAGHLVHTASAAGLLMQLGAAPYSVTKHAVVAFAEWLSVTYHGAGIRVSCLCPQAVATNLGSTSRAVISGKEPASPAGPVPVPSGSVGGRGTAGADGVVSAERCAELVLEAVRDETFLVLPHAEVERYERNRADDRERWLRGMRKAQAAQDAFVAKMAERGSS